MEDTLYQKFIDDRLGDLQKALIYCGVMGILKLYTLWLEEKGHLVDKK